MTSFRERRFELFFALLDTVPKPVTILDVGGTPEHWRDRMPEDVSLTLLNVEEQTPTRGATFVRCDACDLSRFGDGSFDVAYSNSVIGHVGGWERQRRMAEEVRRVGRRYFVQTPNKRFPVDWRTLVPFFHWLPPDTQAWLLHRTRVGRYVRIPDAEEARRVAGRVRNLTGEEVEALFPDATLVPERVLGLAKSFVAYAGFDAAPQR